MTLVGLMPIRKPGGRTLWYYRTRGHKPVRLPDLPHDNPAFLAAYAAAKASLAAPPPATEGSIAALCRVALASSAFHAMSAGYRRMLRRHLDAIRTTWGSGAARTLKPEHIAADVAKAESPMDRLKAWRFLCARACDPGVGLLKADPSAGVEPPAKTKSEGHPTWTADDVDKYRARWPIGTAKRAAFELLYWTAARAEDSTKLGKGMVDREGLLTYRQGKTAFLAHAPWTCPLPAYAQAWEADRRLMHEALKCLEGHMTFLATAGGESRSEKGLVTMIRDAARLAGVEKSAHGLRKARATALAEAGATAHQLMAWTGHRTLKEAQRYTEAADRRRAVMGEERTTNIANAAAPARKRREKTS